MSSSESSREPFPRLGAELIDRKFAPKLPAYLFQVGLATAYLAAGLIVVHRFGNLAVVSAIAASAFIAFCLPTMPMARPRHIAGGHLLAVLVTACLSPVAHDLLGGALAIDLIAASAVGLTMLGMVALNVEHAPAAGTALGLTLQPWNGGAAVSVLAMALLLVVIARLLRSRLISLL